jgi:chemotaxis protein methyltransferase CheR
VELSRINDDEIELLVNYLLEYYGYDFSGYARASLKRRVNRLMTLDKVFSFKELRVLLQSGSSYLKRFIEEITVNVTEMFRDPNFYRALRDDVLPQLATRPFIRIWHAGCSTGEEVYSMAIMLQEANLLQRSLLYATDINPAVLEKLKRGVFSLSNLKLYSENYRLSGGKEDFSRYYTAKYDWAKFDESLSKKIVVATHNLVADRSFNEFQLILCRNVLIYFEKELQDKVIGLFDDSLERLGFLALGAKESLKFSPYTNRYSQLPGKEKIWRKMQ